MARPAEEAPDTHRKPGLHLAVSAVMSPVETYEAYRPIVDYFSRQIGRPVSMVQRRTYAEINDLIRTGDIDIAFICAGAYVEGHREFGLELLAAPRIQGSDVYYSYVIVAWDSPARRLDDLRGVSFAFTDPLSNSGHLTVRDALRRRTETPATFFSRTSFTNSHDNSISAVASGRVGAAAVDSLVYDRLVARQRSLQFRTRVIERYGPFATPPVVTRPDLDATLKDTFRRLLLEMPSRDGGPAALKTLGVDRFEAIDDRAYDSVRAISPDNRAALHP